MQFCKTHLVLVGASFLGALLGATNASAAAPVDIRQGIVAYWPLDETPDGLTTLDQSPFGNHLNLVTMDSSNFVPGRRGNAAQFNGTDELLSRIYTAGSGNGLPVTPTRRFTVAFWVNAVGATQGGTGTGDRRIFSEGSTANNAPLFNIGTDSAAAAVRTNVIDIFIRNDGNTAVGNHRKTVGMPLDGTWHHVAWVQNDNFARVYIDGVQDATDFTYPVNAFTLNTISLGGIQRAAVGSFFAGQLDEATVWQRPLSVAEIQEVMNTGLTIPLPEYPPLIITEPVGATVNLGDNYRLTTAAIGNTAVSYQWIKDGVDIPGATDSSYNILSAVVVGSTTYAVRVSNLEGTVTSADAVVTVIGDPPSDLRNGLVSYWPLDTVDDTSMTSPDLYSQNNLALTLMSSFDLVPGNTGLGEALHFTAGSTYAQRVGGFPAYNNLTHSVSFWVKGSGTSQFDVRVYSEGSSANNTPLFTLGTLPSPGGAGMRVFIRSDGNVALLTQQTTRPVFDDAWHHVVWVDSNGVARVYVDGVQDPSSFRYTRGTLTLNISSLGAVLRAAAGNFYAGDIDEVAVWNRTLTHTEVNEIYTGRVPRPITVIPPEITKQPKGADVFEGTDVTLTVEALGTALQYQWRKDGVNISDATNSVLALTGTTAANSGIYTVRVSNSAGNLVSDPANVLVTTIVDVTTGLVAYWPLDAVNGTTTPDTTGHGNDLTLINMDASNLVPGRRGQGMAFNGVDELAVRDHSTTASVGLPIYQHPAFTVALWVNGLGNAQPTTPVTGDRRVFSEASTLDGDPLLNLGTDNANAGLSADIYVRDDGGGIHLNHLKSGSVAFDGNWHHLVYMDRNGAGQLYVDGVLDSVALNYTRTALTPNTTTVGGILRAAQSHWFLGSIDDVAVWRRALSQTEVTSVMNRGAVPPPVLTINQIQVTDTTITLTFTVPDPLTFYCIEQKDDLTSPTWSPVEGFTLVGPEGDVYRAEFPRTAGSQKFYRVFHCP